MSERLTEEQEREGYARTIESIVAERHEYMEHLWNIDNLLDEAGIPAGETLWRVAELKRQCDDAKEVSARVWEAAFGSAEAAPADWEQELQAMRAARGKLKDVRHALQDCLGSPDAPMCPPCPAAANAWLVANGDIPSATAYTTEPPTEAGWYWWRFDEAGEWAIVRVAIINREARMYLNGHADNYRAEYGHWARALPPGGK